MKASEILTKFETMIGDSLDQDFELQLAKRCPCTKLRRMLNQMASRRETPRTPPFAGQTYTTAIDLPTDFFLPAPYIYVGTERYYQVPFERAVEYRDSSGYY